MKKILILLLSSAGVMLCSGCHKTWNCECRVGADVVEVTPIHDLGRMGAKTVCQSYETQNNMHGAHELCSLK